MNSVLIGLLGVMTATNQPAVVSNLVQQTTGVNVAVSSPQDPVEQEYSKLLADDDAGQAEVDKWIQENDAFAKQGGGAPREVLNQRIRERLDSIRVEYQSFLARHPEHVRARVAYASFLGDLHEEDDARFQLQKALQYDTNNAAIYNNLGNLYGHSGEITNAFKCYEQAIRLNPRESLYYHNFGTTVYLFRNEAMDYFHISLQEVFNKALSLYSNALTLDPTDFPLASDIAQTYYGIQPLRTEAALSAWTNTLQIARDEIEREGVYIHLARIKLLAGRYSESRAHLNAITNAMYDQLKNRLQRTLDEKENELRVNKLMGTTNALTLPEPGNLYPGTNFTSGQPTSPPVKTQPPTGPHME